LEVAKPRLPHLVDQGWVSDEVGTRGSGSVRIQDQLVDQEIRGQMLCSLTYVAGLQRGGVSQLMLNAHVVLLGDGRTEVGIKCVDSRARETRPQGLIVTVATVQPLTGKAEKPWSSVLPGCAVVER